VLEFQRCEFKALKILEKSLNMIVGFGKYLLLGSVLNLRHVSVNSVSSDYLLEMEVDCYYNKLRV